MIIASSAKKELAIPMQVLQQQQPSSTTTSDTSTTTNSTNTSIQLAHEYCRQQDHKDVIHFTKRDSNIANDFVTKVFSRLHRHVDELMLINVHESCRPVQCEAFIHENTVFLTSPVKEQWNDGEFQSCVTHLIELAEEKTGCEYLVIAIDRRHCTNNHNAMLRAFMYLGFQMIDPSVYGQEAGYILVGYEL